MLRVKRHSLNAVMPTRGSLGAAGYDLSSAENTVVPARGKQVVATDLSLVLPQGVYARIEGRSGLAAKSHIAVAGGVVDPDFTGKVGVILFNHSDQDFKVSKGDRIAQVVLVKFLAAEIEEIDELPVTQRGEKGFGSSGIASK